jgi:putative transposase
MPQSLAKVYLHLVFSTKNRTPVLHDSFRDELHNVMGGLFNGMDCQSLIVGSVEDHVHGLCVLSRTKTIADVVSKWKTGSTDWIRSRQPALRDFHWQSGYGAFSVSQSQVEVVRHYIRNQREHHTQQSFQDELRGLLRRHDIEFDERYVWD